MDENLLSGIATALDALAAAGGRRAPEALSPGELIAVNQAFGALKRHVEAAFAPVAAEIARQSRVELGKDSLAKKQGFRSPVALIQATTGSSVGDAVKLVQVGEATAPRLSLTGEKLPAKHPHVAAATRAGTLSVTAASGIVSMLDRIALRVEIGRLQAAERQLVAMAPGLRADELARLLARAEATLDPDGLEPRHEQARAERSLEIHERDGRLRITGELDIETGAPIKTVIDAMVTHALRANHEADDATRDQRTPRQMRADALAAICRHAIGCDELPTGPSTTVIVRMTLDELQTGTGAAVIDGIDQPLPAAAARRLACDLQVIPWVMGGDSEILDWGRDKRGYTRAQKLALAMRDGGCACCAAPVAWTEVHHIDWWSRGGPTDLSNGILLCTACHHRIHDDGWQIRIDGVGVDAMVWFIPPPWIDRAQTPRPGGRRRYTLTA
ncbi:HNH endonuclease [Microbacterium sp. W1N]|uniref:HNH endonuclease signature motif containing protein n=1 Tax=Microbacterium festucae TaxID=2977531 RepID=UPI0021BF1DDF|nr:HNH endonuclease signature motif containing protein [Microbacterium festucae]MCT9820558.1 HNH endonuclease [Microbacterium festucae]